jgi:hypothetical protein
MNNIETCFKVVFTPTLYWKNPGIKTLGLKTILAEVLWLLYAV